MERTKLRGGLLRKVKSSPNIDLGEWRLEAAEVINDKIGAIVLDAATEALNIALDDAIHAEFAIEYAPETKDPLTLIIFIMLGNDLHEGPRWKFSLKEILANLIEGAEDDFPPADTLPRLREGLVELIAMIDAVKRQ